MSAVLRKFSGPALVAVVAFALGRLSVPSHNARPRTESSSSVVPTHHEQAPFGGAEVSLHTQHAERVPASAAEAYAALARSTPSPARNAAMASALRKLAATDPAAALALAHSERNRLLRETLLHAALSGWAEVAAEPAATWALALENPADRSSAMAAVFAGAVSTRPADAVELARTVFKKDVGAATGYGCSLVDALCGAGHFEIASALAGDPGTLGPVGQSILLAKTYSAWASVHPAQAAHAAGSLADPSLRADALLAAMGGWSQVDPAGATQHAAQLGDVPARIQILGQALRQWAAVDPAAASSWIKNHELGPGADDGIAAVAGAGFLPPATAASWMEDIASPRLRSQTTLTLLRDWANTDPDAARRYFETAAFLEPGDRTVAAALFAPPGGP
jgi:hypothetical protein